MSCVRAFRVVAIPQSGLLAQVRLFWLRVGRSCPILTKHCSLHLPCLPALPPLVSGRFRLLCCFSGGRGGSYCWACNLLVLIIYLFFLPVMLPSVLPRLTTDSAVSVSWCLETSLLKIPFPGQASLPGTELPHHLLCLLFHLLYFLLPVFEDNGLLFWLPDVLCQPSEVVLWSLLSVEMFFWGICEGESGLPVLFLRHLRTAPHLCISIQV